MDFWDLTKLMVRRWYVSVSLLLIALAATAYTAVEVKPDYAITAYIQLIPPTVASDPNQVVRVQNPWLTLGITSLSNAAMVSTQDQTFLDSLARQDESASFDITIGDSNPVAIVAVVAPTRAEAESATMLITSHYEQAVVALQTQYGVKQADMITAYRLDKGENIKRPGGKVKRAVVVVFAIGILVTGGVTILFDALMRKRRRPGSEPDSGMADAPDLPDGPDQPGNGTAVVVSRHVTAIAPANGAAANGDWDATRQLSQHLRNGSAKSGKARSAGTVVIFSTARISDSTIAIPRPQRPVEAEENDDHGEQR